MSRHIRVSYLEGRRYFTIDVTECDLFVVCGSAESNPTWDYLAYYVDPKKRWVSHTFEQDYDGWTDVYKEVDPSHVARSMRLNGFKPPPELSAFDPETIRPKWNEETKTLTWHQKNA